jgi:Transglycosylase SLT domain
MSVCVISKHGGPGTRGVETPGDGELVIDRISLAHHVERSSQRRPTRSLPVMLAMLMTLGSTEAASEASGRQREFATIITAAASWAGIAPELLAAVTWVESRGHPWALGIVGSARHPRTRGEAVALIRTVGGRADIGLAQIHYPIWGPVFGLQPEDLLDPWTNLHVAAVILRYAYAPAVTRWLQARPAATAADFARVDTPLSDELVPLYGQIPVPAPDGTAGAMITCADLWTPLRGDLFTYATQHGGAWYMRKIGQVLNLVGLGTDAWLRNMLRQFRTTDETARQRPRGGVRTRPFDTSR